MKKVPQKPWLVILILLQTFLGSAVGVLVVNYYYYTHDLFLPGTVILGQSVAGLTIDRAEELLMDDLVLPERIEFFWQEEEFYLPLEKGVTFFDLKKEVPQAFRYGENQDSFDAIRWVPNQEIIEIPLEIHPPFLEEGIRSFRPLIDREPVDAELVIEKGIPEVLPDEVGYSLAVSPSLEKAMEKISQGHFQEIPLAVDVLSPEVTRDDIPDFSYRRSFYSTPLEQEQEDRRHNIALSLDAISNIILEPKEVFSFNEQVGKVSVQEGYRHSIVIENNRFVEGVGGGICQVASTLYQVAVRGELEILERTSHSRPVQYVPEGFDAAISYNQLDLKFKNTYPFPLLLTSTVEEEVNVFLYGPPVEEGRWVDIKAEKIGIIEPPVKEIPDPELLRGKEEVIQEGVEGSQYRVYRLLYADDSLIQQDVLSMDVYLPVERIIRVGTKVTK